MVMRNRTVKEPRPQKHSVPFRVGGGGGGGGEGAVLFLFFSSRTPKTKKQPNNTPFSFPSRDVNTNLCIPLSLSLSLSVCVCVCVCGVFLVSPSCFVFYLGKCAPVNVCFRVGAPVGGADRFVLVSSLETTATHTHT